MARQRWTSPCPRWTRVHFARTDAHGTRQLDRRRTPVSVGLTYSHVFGRVAAFSSNIISSLLQRISRRSFVGKLEVTLPRFGTIHIVLFDILGRSVRTVVIGDFSPGKHHIIVDGAGIATGVYLLRIDADGAASTRTMMFLRQFFFHPSLACICARTCLSLVQPCALPPIDLFPPQLRRLCV